MKKDQSNRGLPTGTTTITETLKKEAVNNPEHYGGKDNPLEVINIIEHYDLDFKLGNSVKYILRAGKKDEILQELKKAQWYLNRKIDQLEHKALGEQIVKDYNATDSVIKPVNRLQLEKFIRATSYDFFEWTAKYPTPVDIALNVKAFYNDFCAKSKISGDHKFFTYKRFNIWMREYGSYIKCPYSYTIKAGERYIIFHKQS